MNCQFFRAGLHNRGEPCLDKRNNAGGLAELPCIIHGQGTCEGHSFGEGRGRVEEAPGFQPAFDEWNNQTQEIER